MDSNDIVRISKKLPCGNRCPANFIIDTPYIRIRLYHAVIRLALSSMRGFVWLAKGAGKGLRLMATPFTVIIRGAFSFMLVPSYRAYRKIKGWLRYMFEKERSILAPLLHVNMAIIVFVALAGLVITNNILIREKSLEYVGKHSILANVGDSEGNESEEIVTDVAPKSKSIFASLITPAQANALTPLEMAVSEDRISQVATTRLGIGGGETESRSVENYAVQGGDTISTIAEQFGVSTKTVLWANGMSEFDFIKPGQTLKIPPVSGVIHQVASGDTLGTISRKYNVSEDSVLEYNKLADASLIAAGNTLVIPGGQPPAPPAPVVSTPSRSQAAAPPTRTSDTNIPAASGARGNFIWPTNGHRINQYFSYRHSGADIDGDYSSPIYASARGVVETVQYLRYGYGYHVIIRHPDGSRTLYGHASKIFVKSGQAVAQGQTIAMVGSTGRSTGTHLHFEIIIGGRKVNPLSYIR